MSMFATAQGDIWSLSGVSFSSPVNDLLDGGDFTLEELLDKDDLIQEVKGKNDRLIQYLSTEEVINHLLDFIIYPADHDTDDEKRIYKYPYISCEVICSEVTEILQTLVEDFDGKYLEKLFSLLSNNTALDYYLAGYFEKILEMLFRKMTVALMKYFNSAGLDLLRLFLSHIDNYSIMQIVQRLMLPHIPFSNSTDLENLSYDEVKEFYQCNWSYRIESCQLLFDRMFQTENCEVPLHISDLLITVLQLSPPETLVIKFLCQSSCIEMLLNHIIAPNSNMVGVGDPFNPVASISLASISVLESLISRLFEASLPFEPNVNSTPPDEFENENIFSVKESIELICDQILPFVGEINAALRIFLDNNPCETLLNQTKKSFPRLGHRGLQLIKLIESLNRLANPKIDASFCENGLFKTCIDLFIWFESNSLLHLSVQRILITIIEGDASRREAQKNILRECNLLKTVIDKVNRCSPLSYGEGGAKHEAVVEMANDQESSQASTASPPEATISRHSSMMGNLILIAQALSIALDTSNVIPVPPNRIESVANPSISEILLSESVNADVSVSKQLSDIYFETATIDSNAHSNEMDHASDPSTKDWNQLDDITSQLAHLKLDYLGEAGHRSEVADSPFSNLKIEVNKVEPFRSSNSNPQDISSDDSVATDTNANRNSADLRSIIDDKDLMQEWQTFIEMKLRPILEHQNMGSFQANANFPVSPHPDETDKFGLDDFNNPNNLRVKRKTLVDNGDKTTEDPDSWDYFESGASQRDLDDDDDDDDDDNFAHRAGNRMFMSTMRSGNANPASEEFTQFADFSNLHVFNNLGNVEELATLHNAYFDSFADFSDINFDSNLPQTNEFEVSPTGGDVFGNEVSSPTEDGVEFGKNPDP